MEYSNFCGIDVSKDTLDCVINKGLKSVFYTRVENSIGGLKDLQKQLKSHEVSLKSTLFTCENTGRYTLDLMGWAVCKKANLWVENPYKISRELAKMRGKTDKLDAGRIAEYGFRFQDQAIIYKPARKAVQELQELVSFRNDLIKTKQAYNVRVQSKKRVLSASTKKIVQATLLLKALQKEVEACEKAIDKLIKSDEKLKKAFKIVTSVEGVGRVGAWLLIIFSGEFERIAQARKMACYAGIAPFPYESGTSVRRRTRVLHTANKSLKAVLHRGALSTLRSNTELAKYYARKTKAGVHPMKVINAMMFKILTRVYACLRDGRPYAKAEPKNAKKGTLELKNKIFKQVA